MSSSRKQLKRTFRSSTWMRSLRLLKDKWSRQRSPPQGVLVLKAILMLTEQIKTNRDSAPSMSTSSYQVCQSFTYPLDVKTAENIALLQRSGITHVVNLICHRQVTDNPIPCTDELVKSQQPAINTHPDLPIRYLKLSMRDQVDSDITFYLYSVIEFIEEALRESSNAKILVHCFKV